MKAPAPGPLVSGSWLARHLDDTDLRIVHVSLDRTAYEQGHVPGAVFSDLHVDMATPGVRPETGAAPRQYLLPTREETAEALARWDVAPGSRIVFYDDAGQGRHAIRGYWLLRLYGFPRERLHVLDGGLAFWQNERRPTTAEAFEPEPMVATEPLQERDGSLIATADEVLAWSREASAKSNRWPSNSSNIPHSEQATSAPRCGLAVNSCVDIPVADSITSSPASKSCAPAFEPIHR